MTVRPRPGTGGRPSGRPGLRWAVLTQELSAAGDAFVAVSLAGSLFFSVSLDAARPRVLLYLMASIAPFAVLAPLIGPFVDRVRGGHRIVVAATCFGRAALCLALAQHLRTLLFYPEAFGILVLGKTYAVARRALVPVLVDGPSGLVAANSVLARNAAVASGVGASAAVGLLRATGAPVVVAAAAIVYAAAGLAAVFLRSVGSAPRPVRPAAGTAGVSTAAIRAMTALRGGTGFLLFELAFQLKRSGQPTWIFAIAAGANGLGGLAGAWLAPRVRRSASEHTMLTGAVAGSAFLALVAGLGFGAPAALTAAAGFGVAAGLGRQAFDAVLQQEAPAVARGRAFARLEAQFQLAWALAGATAVVLTIPAWATLAGLGVALGAAAVHVGHTGDADLVAGARRAALCPAEALLGQAEALIATGAYSPASAAAALAVELAAGRGPLCARERVRAVWRLASGPGGTVPAGRARLAVDAAGRAVWSRPPLLLLCRGNGPRLRLAVHRQPVGRKQVGAPVEGDGHLDRLASLWDHAGCDQEPVAPDGIEFRPSVHGFAPVADEADGDLAVEALDDGRLDAERDSVGRAAEHEYQGSDDAFGGGTCRRPRR